MATPAPFTPYVPRAGAAAGGVPGYAPAPTSGYAPAPIPGTGPGQFNPQQPQVFTPAPLPQTQFRPAPVPSPAPAPFTPSPLPSTGAPIGSTPSSFNPAAVPRPGASGGPGPGPGPAPFVPSAFPPSNLPSTPLPNVHRAGPTPTPTPTPTMTPSPFQPAPLPSSSFPAPPTAFKAAPAPAPALAPAPIPQQPQVQQPTPGLGQPSFPQQAIAPSTPAPRFAPAPFPSPSPSSTTPSSYPPHSSFPSSKPIPTATPTPTPPPAHPQPPVTSPTNTFPSNGVQGNPSNLQRMGVTGVPPSQQQGLGQGQGQGQGQAGFPTTNGGVPPAPQTGFPGQQVAPRPLGQPQFPAQPQQSQPTQPTPTQGQFPGQGMASFQGARAGPGAPGVPTQPQQPQPFSPQGQLQPQFPSQQQQQAPTSAQSQFPSQVQQPLQQFPQPGFQSQPPPQQQQQQQQPPQPLYNQQPPQGQYVNGGMGMGMGMGMNGQPQLGQGRPMAYNPQLQQQQQQQQQQQYQQQQFQQQPYQQQQSQYDQQHQQQQQFEQQPHYDEFGNPYYPSQDGEYWDQSRDQSPLASGQSTPANYTPRKKMDRIDPKQIPRPMENKFGQPAVRYYTRSGASPPSATSDFSVVDEGNCSPRFIRLTTNNIAHEADLIDQTKLCIGAIIQPLANLGVDEEPIPVINYPTGPIRCSRCLAYINPFFQFIDQGARFNCNICGVKNDVPDDYRCNLDANGFRRDRMERPELNRGSVEFVVGNEFILRPIQDPCYLFVIDVSHGAAVSGLISLAVASIRPALDAMSHNPRTRVGILTYDSSVHFYSIKPPRTEPQMFVMGDVDDGFVPCPPDEVLVRVSDPDCRAMLDALLDMIPTVFEKDPRPDNMPAVGAALTTASECLADLGGKILLTLSNLPIVGAGTLQNRDNSNLYGTDKEKTLMVPQNSYYQTLATKCAEQAITVDLYVCANAYVDLATIGIVSEKTGGQIFLYPGFNARKDGLAFQSDIYHNVTRQTGYDAIMIVRCSAGLRVADHYGAFYHKRPNEMDLPTIDADKTFGIRLEHDGKLKDKTEACLQCALLYTTAEGQRRIRVHTISVPVTSAMANIFRFADLDSIINLSLKQAVRQLQDATTCDQAQQALTSACIDSLYIYRKFCASATSAGQLILPEPLKLLPLCSLGMIKHPLFQDGLPADERSFLYSQVISMPTYVSVAFVCPRLFSLGDIPMNSCVPDNEGRVYLPPPLTLSSESISSQGMYLLDDSRYLYIWIGEEFPQQVLDEVFELRAANEQKSSALGIYRMQKRSDDPSHLSSRVHTLIDHLRRNKPSFENLQIITRARNNHHQTYEETLDESLFFSHLIEDGVTRPRPGARPAKEEKGGQKNPNTMSYIDFLCWIHKKIQNKFYQ